ncbi:MAG: Segregation and condensation protein B [Candidatus Beckwithbacteria bacterium GW2011_GWC2_47_9]|uniref:Segregation and condensation protein B n=1 Tax=Candidatus Beckwithbacteria bacterium GW2011_GWC2_47_9 TaxID=1618373 RepID=A0A0G1WAJ3_9BACT|nr:MAG: Segregation and condensation protein B [Candidatus Beckwithbacteria bacterium GW2011_GWC2_47_9]
MDNLSSIIESLLFVHGEPIAAERLAKIVDAKKEDVIRALDDLARAYSERGLVLLEKEGKYQLGTRPENAPYVEKLVKSDFSEELSKAALETIAIIAYKGPLARADIEFVRGVNSSFTLRNLMLRGLIERVENPKDARAYLYKVSFDFLHYLGVSKVEELPGFEEFASKVIEVFEEKTSESEGGGRPA